MSGLLGVLVLVSCGDDGGLTSPGTISTVPVTFLAVCRNGMAGDYPCDGLDLVSKLGVHEIGARSAFSGSTDSSAESLVSDLWGWTDPVTRTEWALVGHSSGTSFVSLRNPSKPMHAGVLPMTTGADPSDWRDIKVYKDHAFIVADGAGPHGMQVFDLTQLRRIGNAPGRSPPAFSESAHYDNIASAHNIVINEATGFAYAVGSNSGGETCGGGLHMIDIRDPLNPAFAGCFADANTGFAQTGYTHDAMCVVYDGPDTEHRGREICFSSNETRSALPMCPTRKRRRQSRRPVIPLQDMPIRHGLMRIMNICI